MTVRYRVATLVASIAPIALIALQPAAFAAAPDPARLEAAARALVDAASGSGRSGWDSVGQAAPARLPGHLSNLRAPPPPPMSRPQARKREMVRRMFMLVLAHR